MHVLAVMRVIPVDAGIGKVHAVLERAARRHRILRHVRHAVEPVVEPDAVPVHRGRKVGAVRKAHDNRGSFVHLDERSGILAVEAEHRTVRPNSTRRTGAATSVERGAVAKPQQLARPRERDRSRRPRQIRRDVGPKRHQRRRHGHLRMHRRRSPGPGAAGADGARVRRCRGGSRRESRRARTPDRAAASARSPKCRAARAAPSVPARRPMASAVIRIRNGRTRRVQSQRAVADAPSFTTGSSCGGVAHAT